MSFSVIPSDVKVVTIPTIEQGIFSSVKTDNFTVFNLNHPFCPHNVDKVNNGHFRFVAAKEIDVKSFSRADFDSLGSGSKRKIFYVEDTNTFFRSVFYLSISFADSVESNKEILTLFEKSVFIADMLESQSLLSKTKGFSLDLTSRMVKREDESTVATEYMQEKATSIHSVYDYVTSEDADMYKALVFFCSLISLPRHVNSALELQQWKKKDSDNVLVHTHIDNFFQGNKYYGLQSIQENLGYLLFPELLSCSLEEDSFSPLRVLNATLGEREDMENLRALVVRLEKEVSLSSEILWKKLPLLAKHYESNKGLADDELLGSIMYALWLNTFVDKNMTDFRLQKLAPAVDLFLVKHLWGMDLAHTFIDSLNPCSVEDTQRRYCDFLSFKFKNASFSVNRRNSHAKENQRLEEENYAFLDSIVSYENSENLDSNESLDNTAHEAVIDSKVDTENNEEGFSIEDNLLCCMIEHLARIYDLDIDDDLLKEVDNIFFSPHMPNFYVCSILLLNGILSNHPQLLDNSEDFVSTVRFVCLFVQEFTDKDFYADFMSREKVREKCNFMRSEREEDKVHTLLRQGFQALNSCAHTVSLMNAVCAGKMPLSLALNIAY